MTSAVGHIKFKTHIVTNPIDILPTNPIFNQSFLPDKNVAESPFPTEGLSANRSAHRTGRTGVSGSNSIR